MKSIRFAKSTPYIRRALFLALFSPAIISPQAKEGEFQKTYDMNVKDGDIHKVFEALASRAGLELYIDEDVSGTINVAITDRDLNDTLRELSRKAKVRCVIADGVLRVSKAAGKGDLSRLPATEGAASTAGTLASAATSATPAAATGAAASAASAPMTPASAATPATPTETPLKASPMGMTVAGNVRLVHINYTKANDVATKIGPLFKDEVNVIVDENSNSLMLVPLAGTVDRALELIKVYDRMPKQILIEAQVIETSSHFAQEMGISWGNIAPAKAGPAAASVAVPKAQLAVTNPMSAKPNIAGAFTFGSIDGQLLMAKLNAAESNGEAKIISRPKVVTGDRMPAVIESGISYSVKTLSGSAVSDGAKSGAATGGITAVSAGLQLSVVPKVADGGLINLEIDISSSEADRGNSVDGIPGIVKSSAKTMLIVKEGVTATIGGLVKYSTHNDTSGVPFFSRIPLIGWLFESNSQNKVNTELLIFITPHLLEDPQRDASL